MLSLAFCSHGFFSSNASIYSSLLPRLYSHSNIFLNEFLKDTGLDCFLVEFDLVTRVNFFGVPLNDRSSYLELKGPRDLLFKADSFIDYIYIYDKLICKHYFCAKKLKRPPKKLLIKFFNIQRINAVRIDLFLGYNQKCTI